MLLLAAKSILTDQLHRVVVMTKIKFAKLLTQYLAHSRFLKIKDFPAEII